MSFPYLKTAGAYKAIMADINDLLNDINELQKINRHLGLLKQYSEYMLILKCYCAGLVFIFVATKGWRRTHANGFDLLLIIYITYILKRK